ncbi:hypothetical protein BDU57DRAFT_458390, partial [Ampelomyces quisqualis]
SRSKECNRQQSPLLRLPGELRNKVYEYAMTGITVTVHLAGRRGAETYALHANVAATPTTDAISTSDMNRVIGLTRVCRQIQVETHLLPFASITFHGVSNGSFLTFIDSLSNAQRDAISTVQICTTDAEIGGILWNKVNTSGSNDFPSQRTHLELLEWSRDLAFDRLGGLKRVVVEKDSQWVYTFTREHVLRDGIRSLVKGRDVEIIVPKILHG